MKFQTTFIMVILYLCVDPIMARSCHLLKEWQPLCPILQSRVEQKAHKMKLNESAAHTLEQHLQTEQFNFVYLAKLQQLMPKTTTELLMAAYNRGLNKREADLMAKYLIAEVNLYQFKNLPAFDNNTSHIIGREWYEIDYSGENMTWKKQKEKYTPYGVLHFKSLACLKKFFSVESKLPYFNKIYKPVRN